MARRKVTRGSPPRLALSRPRTRPAAATETRGSAPAVRVERPAKEKKDDEIETSRNGDEAPNFLGVYFREMSGLGVMTPEEELSIATRIAGLRRTYWASLFSYPPFIDPIADLIEGKLEADDLPRSEVEALRVASRNLRERETRVNKQEYDAACATLVERMSEVDVDGIVSEVLLTDLEHLDQGKREGLTLVVNVPRQGSRPFETYLARVRVAAV
jgi:RNA polymerase primary sigma factor